MAEKNAEYKSNCTALQCFNLSFFQHSPSLLFASFSCFVRGLRTLPAICTTDMSVVPCFLGIQFISLSHLLLYSFPHKILEEPGCQQILFLIVPAQKISQSPAPKAVFKALCKIYIIKSCLQYSMRCLQKQIKWGRDCSHKGGWKRCQEVDFPKLVLFCWVWFFFFNYCIFQNLAVQWFAF